MESTKNLTHAEKVIHGWKHDPEIQAEFPSVGIYDAYLRHVDGVRDCKKEGYSPTNTRGAGLEQRALDQWQKDPAIREEFPSYETLLAYVRAVHAGSITASPKDFADLQGIFA